MHLSFECSSFCSDLSHNKIGRIDHHAFAQMTRLEDLNVGVNDFSEFPSQGLQSLVHIKAHNNPNLQDFPSCTRFPKVKTLVLSYAYHCCQFMQVHIASLGLIPAKIIKPNNKPVAKNTFARKEH